MERFPELGFLIPTQAKPHNCGNPKIPPLGVTIDTDEATFSLKKKKHFMRVSLNGYLASYILQKKPLQFVHRIANRGAVYHGAQSIGRWLAATSREKRKSTHS